MRIKHVLHFVVLTLMAIQRTSGVAAMPPTEPSTSTSQVSSRFTSAASGSDVRQSAFDSLGYNSGLWRSEYLAQQNDDDDADRQLIAASDGTQSARPQTGTSHQSRDNKLGPPVYSDYLAMIPIEIPVVMRTSDFLAAGDSEAQFTTAMSDWEYAAAAATGSKTIGLTTSGPSATSAIVGFVGIVIVIGAYVSSGKRK